MKKKKVEPKKLQLKKTVSTSRQTTFFNWDTLAEVNDLSFLREKIVLNYPGFSDKTSLADFDKVYQRALIVAQEDMFRAMSMLTDYFNDQHLQLYTLRKYVKVDTQLQARKLVEIRSYLSINDDKAAWEGYWVNDYNDCVIGIWRLSEHGRTYEAIVIEQRTDKIFPGATLATFKKTSEGYYITDFTSPHTGTRRFLRSWFKNDTMITTGAESKWRLLNIYEGEVLKTLPAYSLRA